MGRIWIWRSLALAVAFLLGAAAMFALIACIEAG
jgi:hypothetical protein